MKEEELHLDRFLSKDLSECDRSEALESLCSMSNSEALKRAAVQAGLKDESGEVRFSAVACAGVLSGVSRDILYNEVLRLSEDPCVEVRRSVKAFDRSMNPPKSTSCYEYILNWLGV